MLLRVLQRVFVTAVFLPLALVGVGLTIFRKRTAALIILSVVPLYYFTVQSAFHTEYRYVLAVNYFLFAFAAVTIAWVGERTQRLKICFRLRRACSIKSLTHSARASQVPARTAD